MAGELHLTHRGLKVLRLMLANVREEYAGTELMELTGVPSGNLYPLLIKFQRDGLLESRWEDIDPKIEGRPRRRFYRLTPHGVEVAQRAFRELALPPRALRPKWGRS